MWAALSDFLFSSGENAYPSWFTYCAFQQTELQAREPCFVPGVCYRHTGGTLLLADWRSKYIAVHTNLAGLQRKWQIWFSVSSTHFTWDKSPHGVPGGTLALSRLRAYFLLLSGQWRQFWSGYWPNQILCSKTGTPHLSPAPEGLPEKNIWYTNVINDITWNKKYFQKDIFSCFEESSKKADAKQWLRALWIHDSIIIFSGTIPRNHFKRMYVS